MSEIIRNDIIINNHSYELNGEENLLKVIRKAGIQLPTFCYHSELSVYGACRMCVVEVEGQGIVASCSTAPRAGMIIKTHTKRLQHIRKMALELLLANHDRECTTCERSGSCKLQDLAEQFGIKEIRFGHRDQYLPIDASSPSLVRDPNKCILCGDCVRMCQEVQGIGVLDFANRGSKVVVTPAFNKNMAEVDCVNCGQCASICPTGALVVKSEREDVWSALQDDTKTVIVQIAPAVRVAIGEEFGGKPGDIELGKLAAALRRLGFGKIFDTSFTADLTVMEETREFLQRFQNNDHIPQFTSCCPAWVKYAEQYHADLLDNLSSCKSPQQMFGSIAKEFYAKQLGIEPKDLIVVSLMPCSAKKFEAKREEFSHDGVQDVDFVLTTHEIAKMIKEAGIIFNELEIESLDMPFGFATGAGVIFGVTGGVAEAALRAAYEMVTNKTLEDVNFKAVRGMKGIKEAIVDLAGTEVKIAVVHGLGNVKELLKKIKAGEVEYHLVEVMACPGGCVGGAGQPFPNDTAAREERAKGIYRVDRMLQIHKSQDNPVINNFYKEHLDELSHEEIHHLLHTNYGNRRRIKAGKICLTGVDVEELSVSVCVGTCCYLGGSYDLLQNLMHVVENDSDLKDRVNIQATFCFENCQGGPTIKVGDEILSKMTVDDTGKIIEMIKAKLGL
ncbi:MAG: [FeFe] hydrogenase, group A [Halanaerobiales bacterium]|nr:[FeFe] hydrogenase, group A [Halanaerobiales bacterium]